MARLSHPVAVQQWAGHAQQSAPGFPLAEEGGREAVLSVYQALPHLHPNIWRKAPLAQGQPHLSADVCSATLEITAVSMSSADFCFIYGNSKCLFRLSSTPVTNFHSLKGIECKVKWMYVSLHTHTSEIGKLQSNLDPANFNFSQSHLNIHEIGVHTQNDVTCNTYKNTFLIGVQS